MEFYPRHHLSSPPFLVYNLRLWDWSNMSKLPSRISGVIRIVLERLESSLQGKILPGASKRPNNGDLNQGYPHLHEHGDLTTPSEVENDVPCSRPRPFSERRLQFVRYQPLAEIGCFKRAGFGSGPSKRVGVQTLSEYGTCNILGQIEMLTGVSIVS